MLRKRFFVIEGIDGSGKSSLINQLKSYGFNVTREPTSISPYAIAIREHLMGVKIAKNIYDLFWADRCWHINQVIRPIQKYNDIISDRYFFSTAAYQGNSPKEAVGILRRFLKNSFIIEPDLVLYLDLPPKKALKRIKNRSTTFDLFETEIELTRIYSNYEAIWKECLGLPIVRLDATKNKGALISLSLAHLQRPWMKSNIF